MSDVALNPSSGSSTASLPDGIRGFGHVKAAAMATVAAKRSALLQAFRASASGAREEREPQSAA